MRYIFFQFFSSILSPRFGLTWVLGHPVYICHVYMYIFVGCERMHVGNYNLYNFQYSRAGILKSVSIKTSYRIFCVFRVKQLSDWCNDRRRAERCTWCQQVWRLCYGAIRGSSELQTIQEYHKSQRGKLNNTGCLLIILVARLLIDVQCYPPVKSTRGIVGACLLLAASRRSGRPAPIITNNVFANLITRVTAAATILYTNTLLTITTFNSCIPRSF